MAVLLTLRERALALALRERIIALTLRASDVFDASSSAVAAISRAAAEARGVLSTGIPILAEARAGSGATAALGFAEAAAILGAALAGSSALATAVVTRIALSGRSEAGSSAVSSLAAVAAALSAVVEAAASASAALVTAIPVSSTTTGTGSAAGAVMTGLRIAAQTDAVASASGSVTTRAAAPVITGPNTAQELGAVFMLTGTGEAAGMSVRVTRQSDAAVQGTATVQADRAWSLACVMPASGTSETFSAVQYGASWTDSTAATHVIQVAITGIEGMALVRAIGRKAAYKVSTPTYVASIGCSFRYDTYFGWQQDPQNDTERTNIFNIQRARVGAYGIKRQWSSPGGVSDEAFYVLWPLMRHAIPLYILGDPAAPNDPALPGSFSFAATGQSDPPLANWVSSGWCPWFGYLNALPTLWATQAAVLDSFVDAIPRHGVSGAVCIPSGVAPPYAEAGHWDSIDMLEGASTVELIPSLASTAAYAEFVRKVRDLATTRGDSARATAYQARLDAAVAALAYFKHKSGATWNATSKAWDGGTWDGWYFTLGATWGSRTAMNHLRNFAWTNKVVAWALTSSADLATSRTVIATATAAGEALSTYRGFARLWVHPDLPPTDPYGPGYVDSGYWPGDQSQALADALNAYSAASVVDYVDRYVREIMREARVGGPPWEFLSDPAGGIAYATTAPGAPGPAYHGAMFATLSDAGNWLTDPSPTITASLDGALNSEVIVERLKGHRAMGLTVTAPSPVSVEVSAYARQEINFDGDPVTKGPAGIAADDFAVDLLTPKSTANGVTTLGAYDVMTGTATWVKGTPSYATLTANNGAYRRDVQLGSAGYVEVDFIDGYGLPGVRIHSSGAQFGIRVYYNSATHMVRALDAGSQVGADMAFNPAAGSIATLRVELNGTTLTVRGNGALLGTRTVSAKTPAGTGLHNETGALTAARFTRCVVSDSLAAVPSATPVSPTWRESSWALMGKATLSAATSGSCAPTAWTPARPYGGQIRLVVTGGGAPGVTLSASMAQPAHASAQLVARGTFDDFATNRLGTDYTVQGVGWAVSSGKLRYTGTADNDRVLFNAPVSIADMEVSAVVTSADWPQRFPGIIARATAIDTFYLAHLYVGGADIYRSVGGVFTLLASGTLAGTPSSVRFVAQGSSLSVYFGSTLVTSATDTAITAAGKGGCRIGSAAGTAEITFDDLLVSPAPSVTAQPIPPGCTLEEAASDGRAFAHGEDYSSARGLMRLRAWDGTILSEATISGPPAVRYL